MFKDSILDKSVYFSFDRSGYRRHAKKFDPLDVVSFTQKKFFVTGGTSGIGQSIVNTLREYKANVIFSGRSLKDETYRSDFINMDLNDHQRVLDVADQLESMDGIVLNAGGMPEKYGESYGYEFQFSSQVLAHFIFIRRLIDNNKLSEGSKVIWMSSGGMYLVKYDESLIKNAKAKYDKVNFYANAKRAQVILNEMMAKRLKDHGICFSVMHPGWVDTTGVRDAIPGFFKFTKNRLRNTEQGADTAVWLLSKENNSSGEFWFDRSVQKKIIFPWTKNSDAERTNLYNLCESHYKSLLASKA